MIHQPDMYWTAVKILGVLVLLLAGLYGCLHLLKRLQRAGFAGRPDQLIRILNIRAVGIKKQIALVEIPGAVLVIGMTGDRMQLLDKIVDPDILGRISTAGGRKPLSGAAENHQIIP